VIQIIDVNQMIKFNSINPTMVYCVFFLSIFAQIVIHGYFWHSFRSVWINFFLSSSTGVEQPSRLQFAFAMRFLTQLAASVN